MQAVSKKQNIAQNRRINCFPAATAMRNITCEKSLILVTFYRIANVTIL